MSLLMKKKVCIFVALLLGFWLNVSAQEDKAQSYFTTTDMPDLVNILSAPPSLTSPTFMHDIMRYNWGKEQRKDSIRAYIAIRDAVYGLETIIKEFSEPFGLPISKDGTPEIYVLLRDALATCDSICTLPKCHYMRVRPFVYFHEQTLTPWDEASLSHNGSYPSGHTILGYSAALLMSEINPERTDTIMARGLMYGESRIIVGAHWQSDVDAGRLAASIAFAKLHTSENFLKQMARARKEFEKLYKTKVLHQ